MVDYERVRRSGDQDTSVSSWKIMSTAAAINFQTQSEDIYDPFHEWGQRINVGNIGDTTTIDMFPNTQTVEVSANDSSVSIHRVQEIRIEEGAVVFLGRDKRSYGRVQEDGGFIIFHDAQKKASQTATAQHSAKDKKSKLDEIIGEVQRKPSARKTPKTGRPIAVFPVQTTSEGVWNVVVFGRNAEIAESTFRQGTRVRFEGKRSEESETLPYKGTVVFQKFNGFIMRPA